jgi:hypothetical protein
MGERRLFTAVERFNVFERDEFRCVYCGKSVIDGVCLSVAFHVDHVYPHSRGGSDSQDNLVTACSDCNIGKGDRVLSHLPPSVSTSAGLEYFSQLNKSSGDIPILERLSIFDRMLLQTLLFEPSEFIKHHEGFLELDYTSEMAKEAVQLGSDMTLKKENITLDSLAFIASGALCRCLVDLVDENNRRPDDFKFVAGKRDFCSFFDSRLQERLLDEKMARVFALNDPEAEAALLEELVSLRRYHQGMTDPKDE